MAIATKPLFKNTWNIHFEFINLCLMSKPEVTMAEKDDIREGKRKQT